MAVLMSDKMNFKIKKKKKVTRKKVRLFCNKCQSNGKIIAFINRYVSDKGEPKNMQQKFTEMKGEMDNSTSKVFKTPLPITHLIG